MPPGSMPSFGLTHIAKLIPMDELTSSVHMQRPSLALHPRLLATGWRHFLTQSGIESKDMAAVEP